jgi:segregation and condensation protein A
MQVRNEPAGQGLQPPRENLRLWKSADSASTKWRRAPRFAAVSEASDSDEPFEMEPPAREAERLTLDLDGWEGPLDLLLTLARAQKVDLARISILALVEQYLAFIADAKKLRLEIAADYLVMAAWLAYLKSCLLLPKDPTLEPGPEELAMRLQLRLQRLQAMREAGARLVGRDRVGRDVFRRAAPEGLKVVRRAAWTTDLYDLIAAYGIVRARSEPAVHVIARRPVMTLDEAIHRLERMIGAQLEWTALEAFLPETQDMDFRRSALASSFVAALELARLGKVRIEQQGNFSTLYVRAA